ncbi:MAG: hypothetical protein K2Z81_21400, partial [Cyanobacteria bacterium]|nr:hypothetical protein [Cyanobacteriota bacterium]
PLLVSQSDNDVASTRSSSIMRIFAKACASLNSSGIFSPEKRIGKRCAASWISISAYEAPHRVKQ